MSDIYIPGDENRPNVSYTQCTLTKRVTDSDNEGGATVTQVAWIPTQYAILNKPIRLRSSKDDPWGNGWVVTEVGGTRMGSPDYRKSILNHRKNKRRKERG